VFQLFFWRVRVFLVRCGRLLKIILVTSKKTNSRLGASIGQGNANGQGNAKKARLIKGKAKKKNAKKRKGNRKGGGEENTKKDKDSSSFTKRSYF
jgi:hypothetical protein